MTEQLLDWVDKIADVIVIIACVGILTLIMLLFYALYHPDQIVAILNSWWQVKG
jgi:hypothetical protein